MGKALNGSDSDVIGIKPVLMKNELGLVGQIALSEDNGFGPFAIQRGLGQSGYEDGRDCGVG